MKTIEEVFEEKSTNDWKKYYTGRSVSLLTQYNKVVLNAFQYRVFESIRLKSLSLLEKKSTIRILSAGSGFDFIAYKLKKTFGDRVDITLFDVSDRCLGMNREMFGDIFRFVQGDIFKYAFKERFDIIYNTGLLEHFTQKEQGKIMDWTYRHLSKGGYYITLNPSTKGRLYIRLMEHANRKGNWPYGREIPMSSLDTFARGSFVLESEIDVVSFSQFTFLLFMNKVLYFLVLPLMMLLDILRFDFLDWFFGWIIGYYGLLSVFRRKD